MIRTKTGGIVLTPNIDHIVQAEEDIELRNIYRDAAFCVADGQPVLWIARALGTPLPQKISGSDLIYPLMAYAAMRRWRVFLFGARPDVAEEAQKQLVRRYPGLNIVGRDSSLWNPERPSATDAVVVQKIKDSRADLVVVALGCPKQELWVGRHFKALAPATLIGLGGSLDFVAGAVPRAPEWMSNSGLEWLFRLVQEPRRLAYRYLVRDLKIIPIFARDFGRHLARSLRLPFADINKSSMTQDTR